MKSTSDCKRSPRAVCLSHQERVSVDWHGILASRLSHNPVGIVKGQYQAYVNCVEPSVVFPMSQFLMSLVLTRKQFWTNRAEKVFR